MEFLSADVYLEEVQGRNGQVPSPSTSTFAIVGYSPRGPEGKAFVHGSYQEFVSRFGGLSNKSMNGYVASAFFANGGSRLIFVRELHSDASFASGSFVSGWDAQASGRGEWANDAQISISGNSNFYDRQTAEYSKFDVSVEVVDPNTGLLQLVETFEAVDLVDDQDPDFAESVVNESSEYIKLINSGAGVPVALQPTQFVGLALGAGDGVQTSFTGSYGSQVPVGEETVKVFVDATQVAEDDGNGNLIAMSGGPAISGTIDYETGNLSIAITPAPANGTTLTVDMFKKGAQSVSITLAGGSDGSAVISSDVASQTLQGTRRGIYALDEVNEQMQLALPDFAGDKPTISALLSYAEGRGDILVICEPPKGSSAQQAASFKRNTLRSISSYGAMYWPWVKVPDALNRNRPKVIPPCGHIAGRMAFTDQSENVGKAPAGAIRGQISFISGLEREVTKTDRDTVYQAQVNPIRSDEDVGTAIWGNKTLQIVGDFTDVNIRRTFIFLEKAQYAGLLDIVFENIGAATFSLIKARLDNFLEQNFLGGVIGSGASEKSQVFKIICDETNNPESISSAKRIVIDEFIKPNLSAEAIHLRIQRVFDASEI